MPSFDRVRFLASALLPRICDVHGLAAAGAMLTCIAIVLDVGQFAKPTKTSFLPAHRAAAEVLEQRTERWNSVPRTAEDHPESFNDLLQTASISFVDSVPWSAPPTRINDPGTTSDRGLLHAVSTETAAQAAADQTVSDSVKSDLFVGVWAPDAGTCSARNFRDGNLPTVIATDGAWAGETFCMFTKKKQTDSGWRLVAKCSSPRERWTANVRLTVGDNRLTWTSERGTQVYTRCRPDVLTAQAR